MEQKYYECRHCGNIAALIRDQGVPLFCCKEKMEQIHPGAAQGSAEKHIPVCTVSGDRVQVRVGSAAHPMTEAHHIQWICLETERKIQYAHLDPGDAPQAEFSLCPGETVRAVYAFCNQHSLWRN